MKNIKRIPLLLITGVLFGAGLASCDWSKISSIIPSIPGLSDSVDRPSTSLPPVSFPENEYINVKIVFNNGSKDETITIQRGSLLSKPSQPIREGYFFVGWSKNINSYAPYDFSSQVVSDIVITAFWSVNSISVTFNSNGGSQVNSISGAPSSSLILPESPKKSGFVFDGWYSNSALTVPFVGDTFPTEDLVLFAKWSEGDRPDIINISWPSSNDYYISNTPNTVEYGEEVSFVVVFSANIDPIKAVVSADGVPVKSTNGSYSFRPTASCSVTVTNLVINEYKVVFHSNFVTPGETDEFVVNEFVNFGAVISPRRFERNGYTLSGFYTDKDLTNKYNFSETVHSNFDLYAKWELTEFKITFSETMGAINDNTTTSFTIKDQVIFLKNLYSTPDGVNFKGWSFKGQIVTSIDPKSVFEDVVLIAVWDRWECKISYVTNSSDTSFINPTTGLYGSVISFPADPVRTDFYFAGWHEDQECKRLFTGKTYTANRDMYLFAKWSTVPEGSHSVTFNDTSGVNLEYIGDKPVDGFFKEGKTLSFTLKVKTEEGYRGSPIVSANGLVIESKGDIFSIVINSDTKITINGISQLSYLVSFNYNYPNAQVIAKNVPYMSKYDETVLIKDVYRSGYQFTGWYFDKDNLSPVSAYTGIIDRDVTLYAGWTRTNYTIKFIFNHDDAVSQYRDNPISFSIDSLAFSLVPAKLEGHNFAGFMDSENNVYTSIDPSNPIYRKNLTLYAKFVPTKFTINFFNKSGTLLIASFSNVDYNTNLFDFVGRNGSYFTKPGYNINTNSMYLKADGTTALSQSYLLKEKANIYVTMNARAYSIDFIDETNKSFALQNQDGSTYSGTELFGSNITLKLSKPLSADERLYLYNNSQSSSSREYLQLDGNNQFTFSVGLYNSLRVVTVSKIEITMSNNEYKFIYGNSETNILSAYPSERVSFALNKKLNLSDIITFTTLDGKTHYLELSDDKSFIMSLDDISSFNIVKRPAKTVSFEDSFADGYVIDGLSQPLYLGRVMTFTINKKIGSDQELVAVAGNIKIYLGVTKDLKVHINMNSLFDINTDDGSIGSIIIKIENR